MVRQPALPFSFWRLASVSYAPIKTTWKNFFEPAFDIADLTITDSSTTASQLERLASVAYMDAVRLKSGERWFMSALLSSDVVLDADGNRLRVYNNQRNEGLPIFSVFEYFAHYSDRVDAERFRFGSRQPGRGSKTRLGEDARLTVAGVRHTRCLHSGERGAMACRCTSVYTNSPLLQMYEEVNCYRNLSMMVS